MKSRSLIFCLILSFGASPSLAKSNQWQGEIPNAAKKEDDWKSLLAAMEARHFYYGQMAAAARVLVFFNGLEQKELAYRTIINLANQGYAAPVGSQFIAGDIIPAGDYDFVNNYNFYKFLLNDERKLEKWAKQYLDGVDKKAFPKYLFFLAVEAVAKKDYKGAQDNLRLILQKESTPDQRSLYLKASRALARTYFDTEEYEKSYDIYSSFLLKLNPIEPGDWLEASWALYYLHRYDEALGLLYNLESKSGRTLGTLEKYTLRALIYKNVCAVPNAEALFQSFEDDFGPTLDAIRKGEPLSKISALKTVDIPDNSEFRQLGKIIQRLGEEQTRLTDLPKEQQPLATYLYRSELEFLQTKHKSLQLQALDDAARQLVLLNENIRFLKYDVQREQHNPDLVFKELLPANSNRVESLDNSAYLIRWEQNGVFWRDERNSYRGILNSKCE